MKSVLTMSSFCVGTPPSWNVWCRLTWATWSRLNPGRRVRARCLVALIGVNKIVIILHSPFLCFSGEPVVPGPCARWIRVARQRWAPSMFDSFVRQRFCHRRHLGGRWWDPYYGRQPRYWFTKSQRDSLKKKSLCQCLGTALLDPSGNAGLDPLMKHIFYYLLQVRHQLDLRYINDFWQFLNCFYLQVDIFLVTNRFLSPPSPPNSPF